MAFDTLFLLKIDNWTVSDITDIKHVYGNIFKSIMRITFDISDDKINNFSTGARSELNIQCCKIAENIIDEASRIEASRRIDTSTDSEVTRSDVKDAANFSRRVFVKKKKSYGKSYSDISFSILFIYRRTI